MTRRMQHCLSAAMLAFVWMAGTANAQSANAMQAITAAGPPAGNLGSQPSAAVMREYRIGADDVLGITVWHEPELSRSVPVRPDGMISLPLVGEVTAAGKTTSQLEDELRILLTRYIKSPEIYIVVAQIRSRHINIIGQVEHPGTFTLMQSMGVLDAIAGAGGLRDFAKKNKIYVLREEAEGRRARLPYPYQDVLRGKTNAREIILEPNDTVVVP